MGGKGKPHFISKGKSGLPHCIFIANFISISTITTISAHWEDSFS
jgi:hypothetical protein